VRLVGLADLGVLLVELLHGIDLVAHQIVLEVVLVIAGDDLLVD
jgi:hypothetical protein